MKLSTETQPPPNRQADSEVQPTTIMPQAVLSIPEVEAATPLIDSEPYYPQCYLYQPDEIELERNLNSLQMALFIAGVDMVSARHTAMIITRIKPGYIISRLEYLAIHQALGEMK